MPRDDPVRIPAAAGLGPSSGFRHSTRLTLTKISASGSKDLALFLQPLPGSLPRSLVRVLSAVTTPQRGTGDICLLPACSRTEAPSLTFRRGHTHQSGATIPRIFTGDRGRSPSGIIPDACFDMLKLSFRLHPFTIRFNSGELKLPFPGFYFPLILCVPLWDTVHVGIRSIKELHFSLPLPCTTSTEKLHKWFYTNNL